MALLGVSLGRPHSACEAHVRPMCSVCAPAGLSWRSVFAPGRLPWRRGWCGGVGRGPPALGKPVLTLPPCLWQILALLDALSTVHSEKMKKAKEQRHQHNKEHFRAKQREEEERLKRQKDLRKKLFRVQGQKEKRNQKSSLKGAAAQPK